MRLTPRQKEIAGLVAKGMTARQISAAVGVSRETVHVHIRQAAERIGGEASPRHRLILWFLGGDHKPAV